MTQFAINFACSLPGEPGCGCQDGDFHSEFWFDGTRGEAEDEARRIHHEVYQGDFRWWLVKRNRAGAGAGSELSVLVDPTGRRATGVERRNVVHRDGLRHATVIILPVCEDSGEVVVQTRPEGKSGAGDEDFFGGHCTVDAPLAVNDIDIEDLALATAVEETNEELALRDPDGAPVTITTENAGQFLIQIGATGAFAWSSPANEERSTLYLLRIPRGGYRPRPMDDIDGRFVPVQWRTVDLGDLLDEFRGTMDQPRFADGAKRVLRYIDERPGAREQLREALAPDHASAQTLDRWS